jgi:hypothetical protein
MSLIKDALKKAQKLQTQGQPHSASSGHAPPPPNSGGVPSAPGGLGTPGRPASPGRDRSMPGQLFMLLAFGAGALIAVSVLATVYLLRQQPTVPVVAQAPAALSPTVTAATIAPEKPAPAPVINNPPLALPVLRSPSEGGSPSNGPAPAQNITAPATAPALEKSPATTATTSTVTAAPAPSTTPVITATSPFLAAPPPPAAPSQSSALDPTKPDPKILAYLDALQVAGIRMSDTGNKVLMNDRVFREGEIVDHLLGLRLTKVENDTLTFVDDRGVIYTKNL